MPEHENGGFYSTTLCTSVPASVCVCVLGCGVVSGERGVGVERGGFQQDQSQPLALKAP